MRTSARWRRSCLSTSAASAATATTRGPCCRTARTRVSRATGATSQSFSSSASARPIARRGEEEKVAEMLCVDVGGVRVEEETGGWMQDTEERCPFWRIVFFRWNSERIPRIPFLRRGGQKSSTFKTYIFILGSLSFFFFVTYFFFVPEFSKSNIFSQNFLTPPSPEMEFLEFSQNAPKMETQFQPGG